MFKDDKGIFKILSDAVSEGIVIVDANRNIVSTNISADTMFGYNKHELIGKSLNTLIPQNYQSNHDAYFKAFYKNSEKRKMGHDRDVFGLHKEGHQFPVEIGLNPFTVFDKTYIMALIIDATERKQVEQERNYLSKIFDDSLNEIYVFDSVSLKFINANYGAQKNLGYSLDELKEMTLVDIKPEFSEKKIRKLTEPLIKKSKDKIEFEAIHKRKDGTTYPVYVNLELSVLGIREVFVAIVLDITEQRNYTQKLEKTVALRTKQLKASLEQEKNLNELKTKFLSLVSHEFKTPLSTILTSCVLLSKYSLEAHQDKREKHIKMITDKVNYLNNILDKFLSIEKLEAGRINYKFTTFRLSKLINEVVYNANMLLKEGQQIKYPEKIEDISLVQDEKSLELALSNLVHNAIKYSSENTVVYLNVEQDESKTTFEITDSGIGIPEKDQKNIFHRYFRAENVLITQGTGIGLNIAKSHIENLGGTITFKSQENKGSTFILTIPNNAS
jgi:PAS domain S-box-containing protein